MVKEYKKAKALRNLREALSVYFTVQGTDEELKEWIEEKKGVLRLSDKHEVLRPVSYVKVEKAGISKTENLSPSILDEYGLTMDEYESIISKCDGDVGKAHRVIQMMAITYNSDDVVIADYDMLNDRLAHKLH